MLIESEMLRKYVPGEILRVDLTKGVNKELISVKESRFKIGKSNIDVIGYLDVDYPDYIQYLLRANYLDRMLSLSRATSLNVTLGKSEEYQKDLIKLAFFFTSKLVKLLLTLRGENPEGMEVKFNFSDPETLEEFIKREFFNIDSLLKSIALELCEEIRTVKLWRYLDE